MTSSGASSGASSISGSTLQQPSTKKEIQSFYVLGKVLCARGLNKCPSISIRVMLPVAAFRIGYMPGAVLHPRRDFEGLPMVLPNNYSIALQHRPNIYA